ncbi:hypothetical protein [Nocardia sp. XZ_19_385]|uniref:dTMP kinase n=1 Tax=Nocardia sp. XZ_19_385 TaxID=2769488 RepID=UPI00188FC042|nr:hypothetical protein [Nocardia sp. XZ_19_385]
MQKSAFRNRVREAWDTGTVVAISGIDGSGKSTLLEALGRALSEAGIATHCTRQPTDFYRRLEPVKRYHEGSAGVIPSECLALLSAADRLLHLAVDIVPALETGEVVLCDRFMLAASAVFSTRGIADAWFQQINEFCPEPHGQILLDIPGKVAAARIVARGGDIAPVERSSATLEALRAAYHTRKYDNCLQLDGTKSREDLLGSSFEYVIGIIRGRKN